MKNIIIRSSNMLTLKQIAYSSLCDMPNVESERANTDEKITFYLSPLAMDVFVDVGFLPLKDLNVFQIDEHKDGEGYHVISTLELRARKSALVEQFILIKDELEKLNGMRFLINVEVEKLNTMGFLVARDEAYWTTYHDGSDYDA